MGESVPGLENCVINPAVVSLEKGTEGTNEIKVGMNSILFTAGALYQVQPSAIVAAYQCFDPAIHEIYEKTTAGENNVANADSSVSEGSVPVPAAE